MVKSRLCMVPLCGKKSDAYPDKVFFPLPLKEPARSAWMKATGRHIDKPLGPRTSAYCCEDHFDLEQDAANIMFYKFCKERGENALLTLKPGVVPWKSIKPSTEVKQKKKDKVLGSSYSLNCNEPCIEDVPLEPDVILTTPETPLIIDWRAEKDPETAVEEPVEFAVSHIEDSFVSVDERPRVVVSQPEPTRDPLMSPSVQCLSCRSIFKSQTIYNRHVRTYSGKCAQMICTICRRLFKTQLELANHLQRRHKGLRTSVAHECLFCDKSFLSLALYNIHLREEHSIETPIRSTRSSARLAVQNTQENLFECFYCGEKYKKRSLLVAHIKDHTYLYKCPLCLLRFHTEEDRERHSAKHTSFEPPSQSSNGDVSKR